MMPCAIYGTHQEEDYVGVGNLGRVVGKHVT